MFAKSVTHNRIELNDLLLQVFWDLQAHTEEVKYFIIKEWSE